MREFVAPTCAAYLARDGNARILVASGKDLHMWDAVNGLFVRTHRNAGGGGEVRRALFHVLYSASSTSSASYL